MKQFLIYILLLLPIQAFPQDRHYTIDTIQVKSKVLNEIRSIIIYQSTNISRTDSVNFLYLIDGEYSDYRFQRIKERFNDSIPNLIAIGIINTDRRRDLLYVNGADKFLDFITAELILVVEKDYKTKNRTLYGHSFGGGFTVYAMIHQPSYFNIYIASSPTPIMDLIKMENYLQIDNKNKITFYFSYGSKDMGQVLKWSQKLKDNLADVGFNKFDWHFKVFEGKNHDNSDIPALIYGLNDLKAK